MINLALRTEYSFQQTYGFIDDVIESQSGNAVGVADINNTFSHYYLHEKCKALGKKAIFGVRLMVVKDPEARVRPRGQFGPVYIFLAKNHHGLKEIYQLVKRAKECFYYREHIGLTDVWKLSKNVIVITPHFEMPERVDYVALCNITSTVAALSNIPKVAINNNFMIHADDKDVYQLFCGTRKMQRNTFPHRILTKKEWLFYFKDRKAVRNTYRIARQCNVEFPIAKPMQYKGPNKIRTLCRLGAKEKGINLNDPVYKNRLNLELKLIRKKNFVDYFLIVQEMVVEAKEQMLVGPSRGSSAGSLVCYLLSITEVDPIKWGLLFARFIDINREDMPDIDIDFPDKKRNLVIRKLIKTNGKERVKNLAVISRMNQKGAIGEFAKELKIDPSKTEAVKNIEASSIKAVFETDIGKAFIKEYPEMNHVCKIEKHARHSGKHAAGIVVASEDLSNFASVDVRDGTIQLEGKPAEKMNLLKIDVLGISTLSVLEEVADLIGIPYSYFYEIKPDDDKVFKLFRDVKVKGVFQFEGHALAGLCRTIKVKKMNDVIAITALARPGPLHSGGANKFSRVHSGREKIEYVMNDKDIRRITKDTMGVIIYQEQIMHILRDVGGFPWSEIASIRKLISKKSDKKLIDEFKGRFITNVIKKKISQKQAESAWNKILSFAAYGFNKSHAVAYGLVSYWTAWAKVHYPLEFLVANLNNPKNFLSSMRLIREIKRDTKFRYIPFDKKLSGLKWQLKGSKIIGPLTNIDGIGIVNAKTIISKRAHGHEHTPAIAKKLHFCETKYDILYPCKHWWGDMFKHPKKYGLFKKPALIRRVNKKGDYLIIAQLIKKHIKDVNSEKAVEGRGGVIYKDNTKMLNITLEDDTGSIMCRIGRFDYELLGDEIAEDGEEESDWYIARGNIINDDIIFLFITEIFKLGDGKTKGQTVADLL